MILNPFTGQYKDVATILDTGSGVNLVSEQLTLDWGLPLLESKSKIVFPNQEEVTNKVTQEMTVIMKLPNHEGEVIEKKQKLRFTLSKNIPYGCLLGIYSLFDLKIGFKVTSKGYRPYFDEEEIITIPSPLLLEDLHSNKISFVSIEGKTSLDLSLLPEEYHEYALVFDQRSSNVLPPHRPGFDCEIELIPGARLHKGPIYPMNPLQTEEADKYIEENLLKGFIRPSKSPAAYPVLFQKKKDGSLRFCVDYRKLNEVTVRDSYPLPLYSLFFEQVRGSQFFTKLDLKAAYNLVRIRKGDEFKTAFRTRKGQYEYLVMPFGLTNAPAVFQRFINFVLSEFINKYVVVYLDDILIFSRSLPEHINHVKNVLQALKSNHLVVKLEKCVFHAREIEFLGHIISGDSLKTDPKKIESVKNWPEPVNVKQTQSFLGFCNYYRRFINNFSIIASPLFNLTKKNTIFHWNEDCSKAFNRLKELLTTAPVLLLPDPKKPFMLETDASHFALGCVLSQRDNENNWHPVGYHSRTFTKAERNYSVTDKELLAIITGLEEWKHLLVGAKEPIKIYTDHRNLLFASKPQKLSMRQARWQEILSYFNYKVIYRPGSTNVRADSLSRRSDYLNNEDITYETILDPKKCSFYCFLDFTDNTSLIESIKRNQSEDPIYNLIIKALNGDNSVRKQVSKYDLTKFTLKNGFLLFKGLICVPSSLRKEILSIHHDYPPAGHLGIEKTAELINRNFYWIGWMKDVEHYIKSCKVCMSMKSSRHKTYGEMIPLEIPSCPWKIVEIDFITNVPSKGCEFSIMVSCDKLTKMAHLYAFPGLPTANEAAIAFLKSVFYLHGLPNEIITDRGSQFTSELWKEIMKILAIKHTTATTGHHTTIGQVERLNQSIEQFIRCFLRAYPSENWLDWLYLVEFIYNNSKNSSTGQPPFLAFNGFLPSFSLTDIAATTSLRSVHHISDFKANIEKIKHILTASQELYKKYANSRRTKPPTFSIGDLVWLRRPSNFIPNGSAKLCPRKYGPFKIIEVLKFNNYKLDLTNSPFPRKFNIFNICELEPFIKRRKDLSNTQHSPEIHSILKCRINPENNNCEYLVSYIEPGFPNKWIDSVEIDEDDYYSDLVAQFNNITNNLPI